LNGQRYFISFIDDRFRFIYLYLLFEKTEALNSFTTYKVEVEKQKEKTIKIVRSDKGEIKVMSIKVGTQKHYKCQVYL
jgi:hypothetical protein